MPRSRPACGARRERRSAGGGRAHGPVGGAPPGAASDKALFIRQGNALTDAKTGAAAPDDPALKPVRANNARPPQHRGGAGPVEPREPRSGQAAGRRPMPCSRPATPPPSPALDTALAREKDASVKQVMSGSPRRRPPGQTRHVRGRQTRGPARHPGAGRRRRDGHPARPRRRPERGGARRRRPGKSRPSRRGSRSSGRCRTSGTGFRSARCCCCCGDRLAITFGVMASSTWPTARW